MYRRVDVAIHLHMHMFNEQISNWLPETILQSCLLREEQIKTLHTLYFPLVFKPFYLMYYMYMYYMRVNTELKLNCKE